MPNYSVLGGGEKESVHIQNCCEFKQTLAGRYFPIIFPSPLLKFWAEISLSLRLWCLQSRDGFSELLWRPFPRTCWLQTLLALVPKVFSVPAAPILLPAVCLAPGALLLTNPDQNSRLHSPGKLWLPQRPPWALFWCMYLLCLAILCLCLKWQHILSGGN